MIEGWLAAAIALGVQNNPAATSFSGHETTKNLLSKCAVFGKAFPAAYRASFVAIRESQQIVAHCDPALPKGARRWHVPIQVNPACWSFHDNCWQQLEVGRRYLIDITKEHGAVNWGVGTRIHLLVDEQ